MTTKKAKFKKGSKKPPSKQSCFFVTPIGTSGSEMRKRADDVLNHVLIPAIGEKFSIVRADEVDEPGAITDDIIRRLFDSDLVVADLTTVNANVMYEVGIRHCFNKPIVQIAQSGEKLPFDISNERTVFFDLHDIRDVQDNIEKIRKLCINAINAKSFRSPVYRVIQKEFLMEEFGGMAGFISTLMEKIESLEAEVASIDYIMSSSPMSFETEEKLDKLLSYFDYLTPYDFYERFHLRKRKV